jgi:ELWxxDGT repeat protein
MSTPRLVKPITAGGSSFDPQDLTVVGHLLYFTAKDGVSGRELWRSNGTTAGTVRVKDIKTGNGDSFGDESLSQLTAVGNVLYFVADDGIHGSELWKSDGTEAGTVLLKDIHAGRNDSNPGNFIRLGNTVYFTADDGVSGMELWKTDGSPEGTVRVKDINPGSASSFPFELTVIGNTFYFTAFTNDDGEELWKSDGTERDTVLVRDIHPGSMGSEPEYLTVIGNTLYFSADDMISGRELWKSDGTPVGTALVKNIHVGSMGSDPEDLVVVGNTLYFTADDMIGGRELWKSTGSSGGTVLVKDINPGMEHAFPTSLTPVGNTLYFNARDGISGDELWKTSGSAAGTVRVKDIRPGREGSDPYFRTALGSTLYFQANDGSSGDELWTSDGTDQGTVRVADLKPGPSGSKPSRFTVVGTTLFFTADSGVNGEGLWAISAPPAPPGPSVTLAFPSPIVTLALSRDSVTEDGPTNLVYTFTRSGFTASALTVNFTVSGSATLGVDYTGIAGTGSTKSITFAPGAATATVVVNPTADRNSEPNETVALRLLPGSNYATNKGNIEFRGTLLNDDRLGTSSKDAISGTDIPEFIDGLKDRDTLAGGGGPDVFGFRYSHSTLSDPDRITDFQFGSDTVDLFSSNGSALPAPTGFSRASNNTTARTLSDLATAVFRDANGAAAGNQALGANRAALVVATRSPIAGTYLFINDGNAARNNSQDLLIHLTGFSGTLPALGVIPVNSVFI